MRNRHGVRHHSCLGIRAVRISEVNIGFVPAMVMAILRRSISEKATLELVMTGEIISAVRAHQIGLIHRI